MSKNIAISLFSSAIHPELWMRLYNSLSSNKVPFEVIFVGNNPPKFKLPDNCHFIYSQVKPAQCFEIGSRYATGDLIMYFGDDCVFSEHALDNLYEEFNKLNDDKIILSPRYVLGGIDLSEKQGRYWADDLNSPIMPAGGPMKRKMWRQFGGIDRRFIALYWDLDIAMRMYEIGGKVVLCENAWFEELYRWNYFWERKPRIFENPLIHKLFSNFYHELLNGFAFLKGEKKGPRLWKEFGMTVDRSLLDQFWVIKNEQPEKRGILSKIRLEQVMPFEDKHILTISQGPKGRWR